MTQSLRESLLKVHSQESLIFHIYVTFSIAFSNIITIICTPMLLIHFFVVLVNEGDFSHQAPT